MPISGPPPPVVSPSPPSVGGGAGRYPHALVLVRVNQLVVTGVPQTSDSGLPIEDNPSLVAFRGWIQGNPNPRRLPSGSFGARADVADETGESFTSHILFCPVSVPLKRLDRIRREPDNGEWFEVASDPVDAAGRGHHFEVELVRFRYAEEPV